MNSSYNSNNLRILVIDDNPAIHDDFKKIFTIDPTLNELNSLSDRLFNRGDSSKNIPSKLYLPSFEIDSSMQGTQGVEKVKYAMQDKKPYSLIFVDIRMPPGLDGIETIKLIWDLDPDVQIVICTAYSDYSWEDTTKELGIKDNLLIINKPFNNVAVRQIASALTRKWILLKENKKHNYLLEKTVNERTHLLQKSLSITKATLESAADGILVVSTDGVISDYNKKFIELWGIDENIIASKDHKKLIDHIIKQSNISQLTNKSIIFDLKPDEIRSFNIKLIDGKLLECYTQPHMIEDTIVGRVWSFRDITKQALLASKLEYASTHDALTKLPNRILLMDRINQTIKEATRNKTMIAVLFFDLDSFKAINDNYTHDVGDKILQEITKRLSTIIRDADTLARFGGDEFILVMPNIKQEDDILTVLDKFLTVVNSTIKVGVNDFLISTSIGVSMFPKDATTPDDLLRNADLAMYAAKHSGGNNFKFFTEELNIKSKLLFDNEKELRAAIKNEEFILNYQPQIDIKSNELTAVEALIRWNHPKKGLVSPAEFIPVAESSGLILQIGEWVLRTACKQNKAWQNQGFPKFRVAVNIASKQIFDPNFINIIKSILDETKLNPKYLEIELTENIIIDNTRVLDVINQLIAMNIYVAFDDFGTGNTGLNNLKKTHVNQLKIDQSFIKNINRNKSDEIIIRAIISIAKDLSLDVIAEGVETKEQLDFLLKNNCQEAQGYYFNKAMSSDAMQKYLSKYIKERKGISH